MSGSARRRPPRAPAGPARAARAVPPGPADDEGGPAPGDGTAIIRSLWIGTVVFLVAVAVGAAVPDTRLAVAFVDLGLFFAGCALFMWALVVAAGRSRRHEIGLWNLFLLEGVAPGRVRRIVLGALAAQIVVALGTAWITAAMAFGCLVPMWGLGHCGLWGARYGTFGPRQPSPGRRQQARRA